MVRKWAGLFSCSTCEIETSHEKQSLKCHLLVKDFDF